MCWRGRLTYLTWDVSSTDGAERMSISIFAGASARLAADPPGQAVDVARGGDPAAYGRFGSATVEPDACSQPPGDDTRIDWGYLYVAAPLTSSSASAVGTSEAALLSDSCDGRRRPIRLATGGKDVWNGDRPRLPAGARVRRVPGRRTALCRGTSCLHMTSFIRSSFWAESCGRTGGGTGRPQWICLRVAEHDYDEPGRAIERI